MTLVQRFSQNLVAVNLGYTEPSPTPSGCPYTVPGPAPSRLPRLTDTLEGRGTAARNPGKRPLHAHADFRAEKPRLDGVPLFTPRAGRCMNEKAGEAGTGSL